jgi:hypothetical protein
LACLADLSGAITTNINKVLLHCCYTAVTIRRLLEALYTMSDCVEHLI